MNVELVYKQKVIGVFSNEKQADKYAKEEKLGTYQIFPLGIFLATDDFKNITQWLEKLIEKEQKKYDNAKDLLEKINVGGKLKAEKDILNYIKTH